MFGKAHLKCSVFVGILLFGTTAMAQSQAVLTVTGTAIVAVSPDMATVSVGVEVDAPTADRALKLNSARMREVFSTLQELGIQPANIQTSQFSVHHQWSARSSSSNSPPKITSFAATNVVTIRVKALDKLGSVLDSLTKSGANRIHGVSFGITKPKPHLDKARILAVGEAQRKAELYAGAAGVALGSIMSINEGAGVNRPAFEMQAMALRDSAPIAEGELSLSAEVTLQYAIE